MMFVELFAKDQTGSIRVWSIENVDNTIYIRYGKLYGELIEQSETITCGKGSRTTAEQVNLMMNSRINKKLDSGYVRTIEEAQNNHRVNLLGHKRPMLARKFINMKGKINYRGGVWLQPKYNGNRCIIKNDGGTNISYSRNGKINNRIDHILDIVDIPIGHALDGELYCHGEALQTMNSWIKKKSPETKRLSFICYDAIVPGTFKQRLDYIRNLDFIGSEIKIADSRPIYNDEQVIWSMHKYIEQGYEGAILRQDGYEYEDSKRSKSLIKVKHFHDAEFLVKDILASKDGFAILVCIAFNGKEFNMLAPGSHHDKRHVLQHKELFIGRYINGDYSELTEDGIPFHPIARYWRDKGSE